MEAGTLGEDINPWGAALYGTMQGVELASPDEEAAYGQCSIRPRHARAGPPGPHPRRRRRDAAFYRDRFRPEFVPAFDAWLATDPLTTAGAPPRRSRDDYVVQARTEAERVDN